MTQPTRRIRRQRIDVIPLPADPSSPTVEVSLPSAVAAGDGSAPSLVWGSQNGHAFHRLADDETRTACGHPIKPDHFYHCAPEAGPDAKPVIGTACLDCSDPGRWRPARDVDGLAPAFRPSDAYVTRPAIVIKPGAVKP